MSSTTKLNEKQEAINSNPRYWEWFQKWWDEDFSWDGLAKKFDIDGTPLQEIYGQYSNHQVNCFGRSWHPIHCPPHDSNGDNGGTSLSPPQLEYSLKNAANFLSHYKFNTIHGVVRKDITSQKSFDEIVWCIGTPFSYQTITIFEASNCLIDVPFNSTNIFTSCDILSEKITSPNNGNDTKLTNCHISEDVIITCRHDAKLMIKNCVGGNRVTITANQLEIDGLKVRDINISPSFQSNYKIPIFSSQITINKNYSARINIHAGEQPELIDLATTALNLGHHHSLYLGNIKFHYVALNFTNLKRLKIENCSFLRKVSLDNREIAKFDIICSTFRKGLMAKKLTCKNSASFLGTKIYQGCNFEGARFLNQLTVNETSSNSNQIEQSILSNANFEDAEFNRSRASETNVCLSFNDTKFLNSTNFDGVLFNGVPKFHGCEIHQETSFRNLQPIPEIHGSDVVNESLYSHYQAAFRTLRQHMERNNSFADAFKFGRLEMIAKQRRINSTDVPDWERFFTRWYGHIADYGQSALQPLKILFILIWPVSLLFQIFLQFAGSKCHLISNTCSFDLSMLIEGLERGTVFALPPFTMLAHGVVDTKSETQISAIMQIISGLGIVVHALASTLMVFLFLLAMKRRLQIR